MDRRIGLLARLGTCFTDHRNPNSIEHSGQSLVAQRIYDLDYEDLNDHDVLRARFWLCLWISGLIDEYRGRAQYRGNPPTGSSTGNRLGLATPELS
ncbi:MAG: transposase [Haliea sp.]|nr:transposase [Haliea sp.]